MPKLPVLLKAGMLQRGVHGVGYSNVFTTFVENYMRKNSERMLFGCITIRMGRCTRQDDWRSEQLSSVALQ
jgi:hypothetical protein